MRNVFRLFFRPGAAPVRAWTLDEDQHRQLLSLLSDVGLGIVEEARGPVPLLVFGRRVLERLGKRAEVAPLPEFADALKVVIRDMEHERLRVMSPTDFPGVGYVFNACDPETWPVQTSR
jgi:hypothetical protein